MPNHIILRLTFSILFVVAAAWGQAAGEPIRLTLDEDDKPIVDDQVAPAQFIRPLGKLPFRPFSFSISEDEAPADEPETEPEAKPAANQETSVTVRPPQGATVSQGEPASPLRVYQIHGTSAANPAAPQGTSTYSDSVPPRKVMSEPPPAEVPEQTPDQSLPPVSRFAAADAQTSSQTSQPAPQMPAALASPPGAAPEGATPETASPETAAPAASAEPLSGWTVTPGQTTLAQLEAAWGEATQRRRIDAHKQVRRYDNQDGFARIEIGTKDDEIVSVYLIFSEPLSRDEVERRFHLETLVPAQAQDNHGRPLGIVYPERGILLPQSALLAEGKVERLILQPPTAEAFLVRSRTRSPMQLRDRLLDCKLALEQEPYHAEAWHETSQILQRLGQLQEAYEAARKATAGVGAMPEHRLHRALLSADLGDITAAIQTTKEIATDATLAAHVRAQAYCQWGDLLQQAGAEKNREAVNHHVKAIETAAPLVNDSTVAIRRRAKQVLIDAHLALAIDIAAGDWEKKDSTVRQWLQRAKIYIDDVVTNEEGTDELRLAYLRKSLRAHSYFDTQFDPRDMVDQILSKHRELVRQTEDAFYHRALEWETGLALSQAVFLAHARGRSEDALALAVEARGFLKGGSAARHFTNADHLLLGNLYFRAGAIEAVQHQNHVEATTWYELAIEHLNHPDLRQIMLDRRGESLVSMGVSYWSTGQRDRGVELTEAGKALIEAAIAQQAASPQKLIIPLDNLAKMYQELGDTQRSAEYTASSQRIRESLGQGEVSR